MYKADNIAQWFLSKDELTPKKLQKLVYYAYAWYLTLMNESSDELNHKLFDEEIQAWVHGPVVPSLYNTYRFFGYREIDKKEDNSHIFDGDTLDVLEQVWNVYGVFNGNELESITHQERPWQEAREGYDLLETCQEKISDKTIFNYYIKRLSS